MTDITDEKAANDQAFEIVSAYLRANGLTMTMDGVASAMRLVKFATAELRRFAELARQDEREACIDIVAFHGGSIEIEAHIRSRGSDK